MPRLAGKFLTSTRHRTRHIILAQAAVLALAPAVFGADRMVSLADCTFVANRDEFLGRQSRDRRDTYERARKLSRAAVATPVSADKIGQHNFIDQEIFGKLIKAGSPAAQLSSDEEFLRRIYLDL